MVYSLTCTVAFPLVLSGAVLYKFSLFYFNVFTFLYMLCLIEILHNFYQFSHSEDSTAGINAVTKGSGISIISDKEVNKPVDFL